ncbi:MAG: ABC-F family ATP-binding cassette domain-containing protein [Pseudomonadota bacterium]
MSVLLQCHNLSHHAGTKSLFDKLNVSITSRDRVGLVGHNGSGKSTLLALLARQIEPEDGAVIHARNLILETVEQFITPAVENLSLFEAVAAKLPASNRPAGDYQVDRLLDQLGFHNQEHGHLVRDLSGGQQNRLMFARAVINEPNLVLFDEPTNHLDLSTLMFFQDYLLAMKSAYLVVSHDREFLDIVTERTLVLRDQRLYSFAMPYSAAQLALEEQDDAARQHRRNEERRIQELERAADRLHAWGRFRQSKSMLKRVERLEDNKTFVSQGSGLHLSLEVNRSRAKQMLRIENQSIQYDPDDDSTSLFNIEDFLIRPGDRVALLGHNGVGKSTLIRQIMAAYARGTDNTIKLNPQARIGYYDQELATLDGDQTVMDVLNTHCSGTRKELQKSLLAAGFQPRDNDKSVQVMSGGEKSRLIFLMIKLNAPNFLILDEPTNHIDIQGKEEMESQLLDANATLLVTSHDRRFINIVADRFVLIENGVLQEIADPEAFYHSEGVTRKHQQTSDRATSVDESEVASRIDELERLLSEDRSRKPKFQKPKRQEAWAAELAELWKRLDNL